MSEPQVQPLDKIVSYRLAYDEDDVFDLLADGYQPYGEPMSHVSDNEIRVTQAMVKKKHFDIDDYINVLKPLLIVAIVLQEGVTKLFTDEELEEIGKQYNL